eukprot:403348693
MATQHQEQKENLKLEDFFLNLVSQQHGHNDTIQIDQEFVGRISQLTIDQLKSEEQHFQQEINKLKNTYSQQEILNKDKYAQICQMHNTLIGQIIQKQGNTQKNQQTQHHLDSNSFLSQLETQYINLKKAKNSFDDQMQKINLSAIDIQQDSLKNYQANQDKIIEYINIPNIANQCLQQDQLVHCAKIIRHYERSIKPNIIQECQNSPSIVTLVDKEIGIIRQKLVKTIYISLEKSFLIDQKLKRSTKDLITILRAVNESHESIGSNILICRAKFLRDQLQKKILILSQSGNLALQQQQPTSSKQQNSQANKSQSQGNLRQEFLILKNEIVENQFKNLKLNLQEFKNHNIQADYWLIQRYEEVRDLIKLVLNNASIAEMLEIDSIIYEFNLQNSNSSDSKKCESISLNVNDLILDALEQMKSNLSQKLSNLFTRGLSIMQSKKQIDFSQLFDILKANLKVVEFQLNSFKIFGNKVVLQQYTQNYLKQIFCDNLIQKVIQSLIKILLNEEIDESNLNSQIDNFIMEARSLAGLLMLNDQQNEKIEKCVKQLINLI